MDKIVGIKRKAQRFVQSGDLHKAVAEYERLVDAGEMDPYDFVYLGDLLVKLSRHNDAVERYRDAITAYERVSLFKNAIAVGKKVLRIRPESFDIHRLLGGLYFLEGLNNDSLFYYMQFLSAAPAGSESASIEEVGLRLLGMPLPSADVALSVVAAMSSANCASSAARPLYSLALDFERRGMPEHVEPLRKCALELDPHVASQLDVPAGAGSSNGHASNGTDAADSFAPALQFETSSSFTPSSETAGATGRDGMAEPGTSSGWGALPAMAGEEPGVSAPHEFGMIDLQGSAPDDLHHDLPGTSAAAGNAAHDSPVPTSPTEQEVDIPALLAHDRDISPNDFRALIRRGEEHLSNGDTARGLRVLLAAGRIAFNTGESRVAENVYGDIVKIDPNHLEALQGLTEIAHINGERAKIVRHGCELGDVLLALERYAEAKLEFERVLQFDPRNEKAKARVKRLNSIDGLDRVTARPLAPVASEVKGATVTLRQEPSSARTQSVLDLSEIMNEFQSAVASQFPVDDAQSHYDLGMTYHEMGMIDQAVSEFEIACESPLHSGRALEMITRCLIGAGRPGDALKTIEDAAALAGRDAATMAGSDDPARMANLFACRGLALEALGRAGEARHAFERALNLDSALLVASDGLQRLGDAAEDSAAA